MTALIPQGYNSDLAGDTGPCDRRVNEILTLRLNSCNGFVDSLISMKNIRTGSDSSGNNRYGAVPLYVHVCDLCTGYSLRSDCAWILSNPTVTFGNDDSPVEVKILLSGARDNVLETDRVRYNAIRALAGNGLDTTSIGGGF